MRSRRKTCRIEDELQEAIVEFHARAVDQRDAILFAVPNGEWRDPATAARLTGMRAEIRDGLPEAICLMPAGLGVLPGAQDLVLLLGEARAVLIEVKRPKTVSIEVDLFAGPKRVVRPAGALNQRQKRFQAGVTALGHDYRRVDSIAAYAALLAEKGVKMRCAPPRF